MAGTDAPSWTFGLALKVPVPLVPGPGTYNVGRELTSVGPRFGRIGTPKMAQQDPKRLMFDAGKFVVYVHKRMYLVEERIFFPSFLFLFIHSQRLNNSA